MSNQKTAVGQRSDSGCKTDCSENARRGKEGITSAKPEKDKQRQFN